MNLVLFVGTFAISFSVMPKLAAVLLACKFNAYGKAS